MKALAIIIAVVLIVLSLSIPVRAADAVQVVDGDDVIQTTNGNLYVGQGISVNGEWITLFNVKFPETGVGAVTFPANQVTMVYHKGQIPNKWTPATQ